MNAFTVSIFLCPIQIRSPFSFPELRPLQSVCDGPANLTEAISLPPGTTDATATKLRRQIPALTAGNPLCILNFPFFEWHFIQTRLIWKWEERCKYLKFLFKDRENIYCNVMLALSSMKRLYKLPEENHLVQGQGCEMGGPASVSSRILTLISLLLESMPWCTSGTNN